MWLTLDSMCNEWSIYPYICLVESFLWGVWALSDVGTKLESDQFSKCFSDRSNCRNQSQTRWCFPALEISESAGLEGPLALFLSFSWLPCSKSFDPFLVKGIQVVAALSIPGPLEASIYAHCNFVFRFWTRNKGLWTPRRWENPKRKGPLLLLLHGEAPPAGQG